MRILEQPYVFIMEVIMANNFRFEDLDCWQHARKLTHLIYTTIQSDGFSQASWLSDEIQRAALAVMSTIAEGASWNSSKEFIQFLEISRSALIELHNYICVALDLGYIDDEGFKTLSDQAKTTSMVISGLIKYLKNRLEPSTPEVSPEN